MIREKYIKSVSFKIGDMSVDVDTAKKHLNNKVYKIKLQLKKNEK